MRHTVLLYIHVQVSLHDWQSTPLIFILLPAIYFCISSFLPSYCLTVQRNWYVKYRMFLCEIISVSQVSAKCMFYCGLVIKFHMFVCMYVTQVHVRNGGSLSVSVQILLSAMLLFMHCVLSKKTDVIKSVCMNCIVVRHC